MQSPTALMPTSIGAAVTKKRGTDRVGVDRQATRSSVTSAAIKTNRTCPIPGHHYYAQPLVRLPDLQAQTTLGEASGPKR